MKKLLNPIKNERGEGELFFMILASLSALVMVLWISSIDSEEQKEKKEFILDETKNIYSLQDTSEEEGSFLLGTGVIEEEKKYVFYVKEFDGALVYEEIPAKNTKIYTLEDPSSEPYLEEYEREIETFLETTEEKEYKLYIPEDAVTKEIKVDLVFE